MISETAHPSPPPLIQDPEDSAPKPVFLAKKDDPSQLDMTKVMAAVGFILTVTILIVGLMWISVQNLEQRVAELENSDFAVSATKKTASGAAAKLASKAASRSTSIGE